MSEPVKTRLVLSFPGFEPVPVEAHRRRFERAFMRKHGQESYASRGARAQPTE